MAVPPLFVMVLPIIDPKRSDPLMLTNALGA
jgi:hypothetical protein